MPFTGHSEDRLSKGRFLILIAVLLCGIGLSFLLGKLGNPFVSAATRDLKIPFAEFPRKLEGWQGEDRPLKAKEIKIAGMDRYLRRLYRHRDGRAVVLYLSYYGNKARGMEAIYHNPTICFPSAGWEAVRATRREIRLVDVAKKFDVSMDTFKKGGSQLVVLNFFIVDGEVLEESPRNKPFWLALDKLRFSTDPGYFVQVQVVVQSQGDLEITEATAADFLAGAGRYIFLHF
jgi:EpsI family protein